MCCLFGLVDYRQQLSGREKSYMLSVLAAVCETRGTDATGIAYNMRGMLRIYKRPVAAHCMRFKIPGQAQVVMGHARMATQGSAKRNYNNHPFLGNAGKDVFALAHNGVLYNDVYLRKSLHLPKTKIQTDSYVAVQLIEQQKALNFESLRYMAERVEGSFAFTALDRKDRLYFVKGDNPLCLYNFSDLGLYLYASTEEILKQAAARLGLLRHSYNRIPLECGEMLCIHRDGHMDKGEFNASQVMRRYQPYGWDVPYRRFCREPESRGYLEEIKAVAPAFGYAPEEIDQLAKQGFSPEELEEYLYCGKYKGGEI